MAGLIPRGVVVAFWAAVGLRNVASRVEHIYRQPQLLRVVSNPSGGVDVELDLPVRPAFAPARPALDAPVASV